MSNMKILHPDDIDESLTKLVEYADQYHVLLPFVDATGEAPEYRSLGHAIDHNSVKLADLAALSAAMQARAQGKAIWFILFNTPWLLSQADGDALLKAKAARR